MNPIQIIQGYMTKGLTPKGIVKNITKNSPVFNNLIDMAEQYGNYNDSKYSDSYGAEQEGEKSLEYMLKAAHQFIKMLKEEASSQEEAELVQEYARKIGEM